jgi:hypothetical protein
VFEQSVGEFRCIGEAVATRSQPSIRKTRQEA